MFRPLSRNAGEGWGGGETSPVTCLHCNLPTAPGRRFCCPGCAAAYEIIQTLGLGHYYAQRVLDPSLRAPRPEPAERWDLSRYVSTRGDGAHELILAVNGLQCGACVWLIESVLAREADVVQGRVNMTTRRLRLVWRGGTERANELIGAIESPWLSPGAVQRRGPRGRSGRQWTCPDACPRGGWLRRRQRHAAVHRHLGRRGRRPAPRYGPRHARSAALGLGADRHAGDCLRRDAILRLRCRGAAPWPHQHGCADQHRRDPGDRA